jgi:WD40 repeat protein
VAVVAPFSDPTRRIRVTDAAGNALVDESLPPGHCDDIAFSGDSRTFAVVWHEGTVFTVYVWDTMTGKKIGEIAPPPGWNSAVGLSPDGSLVAASSVGEATERPSNATTVTVWETRTGQQVFTRPDLQTEADCWPVFSPDGKWIAVNIGTAANGDCRVAFLDVHTGAEAAGLKTGSEKVRGVTFSADARQVAVTRLVGESTPLSVWDVAPILAGEAREPNVNLIGHGAQVERADFSPDRHRILTSGGGVVKLWDSATGRELLTLKDDNATAGTAYFSPDGRTIWGGLDENGHLWGWVGTPIAESKKP